VVAVASVSARAREQTTAWLAAGLLVLLVGTLVRLVARPLDIAAVSAALLAILLWLGAWLVALLVTTPRTAFLIGLVAMVVLDVAALPARTVVDYDQREALYRTDQTLSVPVPAGSTQLVLLVEPVFEGAQPRFSLAGWSCPWQRGKQQIALPVRGGASTVDLQLAGAPTREGEYLLVYLSSTPVDTGKPATACSSA